MIPTRQEIALGIYGAWRLLALDKGGLQYFDTSIEGYWKSFFAAVLVVPGYLFMLFFALESIEVEAGPLRFALVEIIAYVIAWTAFPLAMFYLTLVIDRQAEYRLHIVAHNWAQLIGVLISAPLAMLALGGLLPEALAKDLVLAVDIAIQIYKWYIAWTALRLSILGAIGIVFLNLVILWLVFIIQLGMIT